MSLYDSLIDINSTIGQSFDYSINEELTNTDNDSQIFIVFNSSTQITSDDKDEDISHLYIYSKKEYDSLQRNNEDSYSNSTEISSTKCYSNKNDEKKIYVSKRVLLKTLGDAVSIGDEIESNFSNNQKEIEKAKNREYQLELLFKKCYSQQKPVRQCTQKQNKIIEDNSRIINKKTKRKESEGFSKNNRKINIQERNYNSSKRKNVKEKQNKQNCNTNNYINNEISNIELYNKIPNNEFYDDIQF